MAGSRVGVGDVTRAGVGVADAINCGVTATDVARVTLEGLALHTRP